MVILMIVVGAIVIAFCAYVAWVQVHHVRTPPELRGNWWADFERQFREHAAHVARDHWPHRHHHQHQPKPPPAD